MPESFNRLVPEEEKEDAVSESQKTEFLTSQIIVILGVFNLPIQLQKVDGSIDSLRTFGS